MTNPGTVQVPTAALRAVAATWDDQAARIGTIPAAAHDASLHPIVVAVVADAVTPVLSAVVPPVVQGINALFAIVVPTFDAVGTFVADRCAEGSARLGEMAASLRSAADTYDAQDRSNAGTIFSV